jgi:hypothetical protein
MKNSWGEKTTARSQRPQSIAEERRHKAYITNTCEKHSPTAASVWPLLTGVPPTVYLSGTICPGLVKSLSSSLVASNLAVYARSCAEIPVVTTECLRALASTVRWYAVPLGSWETPDVGRRGGKASVASREGGRERQMKPDVCRMSHAMPSVVILEAAQTTSPSFSRVASSITTTNSPRWMAAIAAGTGSKVTAAAGAAGARLDEAMGSDICGVVELEARSSSGW